MANKLNFFFKNQILYVVALFLHKEIKEYLKLYMKIIR